MDVPPAPAAAEPAARLLQLASRLAAEEVAFAAVVDSLMAGHGATLDGVRGSSCALVLAALVERAPGPVVALTPHPHDVDPLVLDLALFTPLEVEKLPAWETLPTEHKLTDEVFGDRLRLIKQLGEGVVPRLLVASIHSLLQPLPSRALLASRTRMLAVGDLLDLNDLLAWLVEQGFHNTTAVELPGEFALRGGILDLFAPDWHQPARIELFGDQVESIRRFEVSTQRSLAQLERLRVTVLEPRFDDREHLAAWLPANTWFVLVEPRHLEEEGRHYLARLDEPTDFFTVSEALNRVYQFPSVTASAISLTSLETTCHLKIESVERFSGDIQKVRTELESAGEGNEVFVVCQTDAEAMRLAELFADTQLANLGRLHFPVGHLRAGFRLVNWRHVLVGGHELFHRTELPRPTQRRLGRVIDSFLDLREGDYVVHITHGIGRYRGLKLLEKDNQTEEHLQVEFDGSTIFVPASKIELVQKYVGGTKSRPKLAKLGGKTWTRQKAAAEAAVFDLASEMLELQAARAARPGIAFPADTDWQREFDASFPYQETSDQLAGIAAIRRDMQAPRPMDRLVCGDVGYGKTELAMRAAFKAVDAGYQVAVLVPTTVLAEQHGRTFRERLAEFPFQIRVLSRFCTQAEQTATLKGLADGSVDIVIGTHRLAQPDLQFHNLGLLVIDEEQRFGVDVKERLKAYRQIIDVLTLTATPIPRTLHMSLLGLRDISNLETAPADRLAVETRVTRFDPELVRHALLRELNRGGQAFFVHNRVKDIEKVAWRLQQIVPEARIGIGHGQMAEGALEEVMLQFVNHEFDLLVATTIIESGLDIPNANTMFIDDADQYGLADLHQLRGRVGRYKHRAYCYLLLNPDKPLTSTAARRLSAIEEFSDMGAGFAIAMRDLEIRGAGNLLGTQQSGHIATVGYELYCELLERSVRRLRKLPPKQHVQVSLDLPGDAYLPRTYVPDLRLKIDLYRRLARVASRDELADLRGEMLDRFGPLPVEVERLLAQAEVRVLAHGWGIESIHLENQYVVLGYVVRGKINQLAAFWGKKLRIADARSAYLPINPAMAADGDALLKLLKSVLQPGTGGQ